MAAFPSSARVVIIGQGGIVGASVAHHLIERGWDDIVGIDKSGIPTDIGSTAHASDFCYATSHDHMSCYTTMYSIDFYERMGRYSRIGGLEVARVGDDERMEELKRKVGSAKAFGTNARLISAREAKERFPLLEEHLIQGALWDPDAGLVVPRSQTVAGELVSNAEATGKLSTFANTPATGLDIANGRIRGVHTPRGTIETPTVVVCAGLWGRLIAVMAGEDLPVMPVDHPLGAGSSPRSNPTRSARPRRSSGPPCRGGTPSCPDRAAAGSRCPCPCRRTRRTARRRSAGDRRA